MYEISPQLFLLTEEYFENKLRSLRRLRPLFLVAPKPRAHGNESTGSCVLVSETRFF